MAGFFWGIGILIMLGAGGCSIAVLIDDFDLIGIVSLVGGIPFAVGFVIFLMSRGALKRRYEAQQPDVKED